MVDLEEFVKNWVKELSKPIQEAKRYVPDHLLSSYFGPACPYANSVWTENKVKIVQVKEINEFWLTVSSECNNFNNEYDVVIVGTVTNEQIINGLQLGGGVDSLNNFLNTQNKNLWLLDYQCWPHPDSKNIPLTFVIIQKITELDNQSKFLEKKGYYKNRYDDNVFDKNVIRRRKLRENLKLDKNDI